MSGFSHFADTLIPELLTVVSTDIFHTGLAWETNPHGMYQQGRYQHRCLNESILRHSQLLYIHSQTYSELIVKNCKYLTAILLEASTVVHYYQCYIFQTQFPWYPVLAFITLWGKQYNNTSTSTFKMSRFIFSQFPSELFTLKGSTYHQTQCVCVCVCVWVSEWVSEWECVCFPLRGSTPACGCLEWHMQGDRDKRGDIPLSSTHTAWKHTAAAHITRSI
jgi:hypothetical protein